VPSADLPGLMLPFPEYEPAFLVEIAASTDETAAFCFGLGSDLIRDRFPFPRRNAAFCIDRLEPLTPVRLVFFGLLLR